jgi:hypothetical protein
MMERFRKKRIEPEKQADIKICLKAMPAVRAWLSNK